MNEQCYRQSCSRFRQNKLCIGSCKVCFTNINDAARIRNKFTAMQTTCNTNHNNHIIIHLVITFWFVTQKSQSYPKLNKKQAS